MKLDELIYEYKIAVYNLATEMSNIKNDMGRKTLEDVLEFDIHRIRFLCRIGDIYGDAHQDLLPELVYEVSGETKQNQKRYLKMAVEKKLRPSELRAYIRSKKKNKSLATHDVPIKVNGWAKNILLLENDIKSMSTSEKQRALAHITNTILNLNHE